ncbi:MAG: hypothetical protein ACYSUY_21730 [Planctomycetota bacterium]
MAVIACEPDGSERVLEVCHHCDAFDQVTATLAFAVIAAPFYALKGLQYLRWGVIRNNNVEQ